MTRSLRLMAFATILGVALGGSGCGSRPRIAPLSATSIVVAFGDSITEGTGAGPGETYPAVLGQMLNVRVVNSGNAGETSAGGLKRLPSVLEEQRPQLVILCHVGNDLLARQDHSVPAANLDAMVRLCRESGADVVLIGVPEIGLPLRTPRLYRDLARKYRLPYDGETLPGILSRANLKSDPVHPNAAGYRKMAEAVAGLITQGERLP